LGVDQTWEPVLGLRTRLRLVFGSRVPRFNRQPLRIVFPPAASPENGPRQNRKRHVAFEGDLTGKVVSRGNRNLPAAIPAACVASRLDSPSIICLLISFRSPIPYVVQWFCARGGLR